MKKQLTGLFVTLLVCFHLYGQEQQYLVFEFIKVEPDKVLDYLEYKDFLANVHKISKEQGHINGWDLWSLQSGSDLEGENFQYVTVTYYSDPVKMMNGNDMDQWVANALKAYPDMSEEEARQKMRDALDMRDLAVRSYMVEVARTDDDFEFRPGILASFDLMKAVEGKFQDYERAEQEVFLPHHQRKIKADLMENWCFLRTALPTGSEAKSTHMTMNVYSDYLQFFNSMEFEDMEITDEQQLAVEEGLNSRDQKWVYLATLETVVR
ncbi:hypothetical protein SAMN04488057_103329 [Cyclobacterium lianum]|uniref:NIPSNAP protein n=1 Tax=Cyclobacterium lianum TaxID=388280 RepID=A0A1M7LL81_9BACT|nr:hypothetical protein [Cyclobacterium lianum]SHM78851.1 hypothetical protein SAMN04488057_103329 [Cyclobacterium lianum]